MPASKLPSQKGYQMKHFYRLRHLYLATAFMVLSCASVLAFNFGFNRKTSARFVDLLPSLTFTPMSATFGNTTTGKQRTAWFTVANSGNDTATNVASTTTGTHFSLYSTTTLGNISASRTRTVKVKFAPTAAGSFTGYVNMSAPNIAKISRALSGTGVAPVSTYDIEEYFTTGSIPTGWTAVSSTMTYNYATSPAPLQGTYSMFITGGSTTRRATSKTYAASGDYYAAVQFNYAGTPGIADPFFAINRTDAFTQLCKLSITTSNHLGVQASGGSSSNGATTLTPGTTYWAALHYVAGTGANAQCRVYVASSAPTSAGAWGSIEASSTNGTTTALTDRLFFGNPGDAGIPNVIVDSVKSGAALPLY